MLGGLDLLLFFLLWQHPPPSTGLCLLVLQGPGSGVCPGLRDGTLCQLSMSVLF